MINLRHVALRCKDMEKSRQFYELFGMRFLGYRPSGRGLDLSDGTVNMTLIMHEGERPYLEEGEEYIHIGFIVDDVGETWRKLRQFGATVLRYDVKTRDEVDESRPPVGSFKVADPDGNTVDITDNRGEWPGVRVDPT